MAVGKKITDLTASGSLKDTNLAIIHDGNGTKRSTLTQLSEYMGTKFSNPNLLINPDFKINQRGQNIYNTEPKSMYTVDRWSIYMPTGGSVKPNSDGTITVTNNSNDQGWFFQTLESKIENVVFTANVISVSGIVNIYADDAGKTITNTGITSLQSESAKKCGFVLTANSSITLKWVKLEQGSIATPFVAPNPAEELTKCQRYGMSITLDTGTIGFVGSVAMRIPLSLPVLMRINPTITVKEKTCAFILNNQGNQIKKAINTPTLLFNKNFICINQSGEYSFSTWLVMVLDAQLNYFLDAEIY